MNYFKIGLLGLATILFAACDDNSGDDTGKTLLPEDNTYVGTFVVAPDTENELTLDDAQVEFAVNENGETARMNMLKVKFAERMPEMDIAVPGVELTETDNGYSLSGEGIIPIAMGGEFPERTITGLTGRATTETLSFDMMCGDYRLIFTGSRQK